MPPSTGASSLLAPLNRLAGQIEGLLGQAEANIQRELDACKVKLSKTSEERDALEARRRETENALRVSEHALMLEQEARRRSEFAREIAEAALRTERNLRQAEQTKIAAERQRLAEIIERIPRTLESRFSEITEEIGRIVDTNRPLPATTGRSELGVSQTAIQRTETQEGAPKRSDTSNNAMQVLASDPHSWGTERPVPSANGPPIVPSSTFPRGTMFHLLLMQNQTKSSPSCSNPTWCRSWYLRLSQKPPTQRHHANNSIPHPRRPLSRTRVRLEKIPRVMSSGRCPLSARISPQKMTPIPLTVMTSPRVRIRARADAAADSEVGAVIVWMWAPS